MTSSKTRTVARMLEERHGIKDPQLAFEIVQYVMTPDDRPAGAPVHRWGHPAVKLAKLITGKMIPEVMVDDVIKALGDKPDEARARECHRKMVKGGYANAWYWLDDYAGTSSKPAPAPFKAAAVYEWTE